MAFLDHLVKKGVLKKSELEKVQEETSGTGVPIDRALIERGVNPDELLKLKSEYFNIPVREVSDTDVPFELLENVPEESALYYKFVPIAMKDNVLEIGILNPDNIGARDAIQFIASKLNVPFKLYLISLADFQSIVTKYKGLSGEVSKALSELETEMVKQKSDISKKGSASREIENLSRDIEEGLASGGGKTDEEITEEAPVTKMVAVILRHAIEGRASDVHIEPTSDKVRVRFRVDGVLHTSLLLPLGLLSAIVARVKILTSSMKLDEKRKPQDGRFSARIEGSKVDFRVSTLPTHNGEKVVIRILDSRKGIFSMPELGLTEENAKILQEVIKNPYGLILLTGPTGSGKTTTLYSMLSEIDRDSKNVLSLEDPVEYNINGMSQSQVRPEIDYTFASGLRSVLRQDPDIIMVGEIRDAETAKLAIQAALTGHLVFSTLHTNNSAGVIPRLIDMGVDPFLIAPTLLCAIAQRLVKTNCDDAKKAVPIDESTRQMIEKTVQDLPPEKQKLFTEQKEMYKLNPTDKCPAGTRGRIGAFEVLTTSEDLKKLILSRASEKDIFKHARQKGMLTMKEDALLKMFKGDIPIEEVNRL